MDGRRYDFSFAWMQFQYPLTHGPPHNTMLMFGFPCHDPD